MATSQKRMAAALRRRAHGPDPAEIAAAPDAPPAVEPEAAEPAGSSARRRGPGRKGARHVGAHVSPEQHRALRMVALTQDKTSQELVESAIDHWILGPSADFERLARERGVEVRDLLVDAADWLERGRSRAPRSRG
ncbi:MAG: hypothetical protein OXE86_09300 [Alphaproteobacteria bacterium]|nr:hypothetical protein [Alphaproteobacteria bacterium]